MNKELNATRRDIHGKDAGHGSERQAVELPAEMAQAIHRILCRQMVADSDMLAEARDSLWHCFRTGRLRICRDGNNDVLGIVDHYRLLRIVEGEETRFAIETEKGERYFDGEDAEEMACHLNWYYLLFWEPDDIDAAGSPLTKDTVRAFASPADENSDE